MAKKNIKSRKWFKQPLILLAIWIVLFFILKETQLELFLFMFLLTPFVIIFLSIWAIILGIKMLRRKENKSLALSNLIIGIIFILSIILLIYSFLSTVFIGHVDLRFGDYCGQTYSGFGSCGYMGPARDCDCTGEKYEVSTGATDSGRIIKCDGEASNFRDVPLPDDICIEDPYERCRLLGGSACDGL